MKNIDLSCSLISIWFPSCFFGQSIIGWNHNSGIRAVVIPPDMVAHALSEAEFYQWMSESLVKLESQLQTVFNEFRSFRTAWEAQSPTLSQPVSSTALCPVTRFRRNTITYLSTTEKSPLNRQVGIETYTHTINKICG
ncbi:hypothetical protein Hanom_Chr07g00658221 [Helianthus anomalus]